MRSAPWGDLSGFPANNLLRNNEHRAKKRITHLNSLTSTFPVAAALAADNTLTRPGGPQRRLPQGGCNSLPNPALPCQQPMGAGRAWERGQWELAGRCALPFKERWDARDQATEPRKCGSRACHRYVPAGEPQGGQGLVGGRAPPREALKGAWGRRDVPRAEAHLGLLALASSARVLVPAGSGPRGL